jgi:hypothetical protein
MQSYSTGIGKNHIQTDANSFKNVSFWKQLLSTSEVGMMMSLKECMW